MEIKNTIITSIILMSIYTTTAQNSYSRTKVLTQEIMKMDSILFNVAFNKCNLKKFKSLLSKDIEFYDDRTGLNTSLEKEINSFKDKCSKPFSVTRRLGSTRVYILGDFGALQTGKHTFYVDDEKVENSAFITIWQRKETGWVVKRAVSFDHRSSQ